MSIILDDHERRHGIVTKLTRHLSERLEELRTQNDHVQSEMTTGPLRGRIAEVKRLLELLATGES